jgi:hypothetical protein
VYAKLNIRRPAVLARLLRPLALLIALALSTAGAAAPAAAQGAPPAAQQIVIESPPPGTQVGSPMTITGNLARLPAGASLLYNVIASDGRVIGSGSFAVPGAPGQPALFMASLSFSEPLEGDSITLQLVDPDPAAGTSITLPLVTAPLPQRILIDTPPGGTIVGNPLVVTGRTVRFPAAGTLGYAIYNSGGVQVGGGVFPVGGSPQTGGSFAASLGFIYPELGGPLRIDLYDQDPFTFGFVATARLDVHTRALRQQVTIETPGPGAQVGSPVTITGRAARFPAGGVLQYRITAAGGAILGQGAFPVQAAPGDAARFVASLSFQPPPAPGLLRAEIFEVGQPGAAVELRWGAP